MSMSHGFMSWRAQKIILKAEDNQVSCHIVSNLYTTSNKYFSTLFNHQKVLKCFIDQMPIIPSQTKQMMKSSFLERIDMEPNYGWIYEIRSKWIYEIEYLYTFCINFKMRIFTCRTVSLMSIPPEDIFCTKSFFSCSSLEKRYAARGFCFEFITSKQSSKFLTCNKPEEKSKHLYMSC